MRNPNFFAACYAIIKNNKGEVLFQKRSNSGFRDGEYQIPAGHIEGSETMKQCMIREAKEELGIDILEQDLDIVHIGHRVATDRNYFDVYFNINNYCGELKICEPEKCSSLDFIDINNLESPELFSYDLDVIKQVENGENFSEKQLY